MAEPIQRIEFTKEMKKDYTILIPNMLDIHFRFLIYVLRRNGYHVELLTNSDPDVRSQGIKYVHNDTCYPALLTIGQMISALKSGKYDNYPDLKANQNFMDLQGQLQRVEEDIAKIGRAHV